MKRNLKNIEIMKNLGIAVVLIGLLSFAVTESSFGQNSTDQSVKPGEMSIHQLWIENNIRPSYKGGIGGENQAMITFITTMADLDHVNADSLADWVKSGKITVEGVQINNESVEIEHSGEIRFLADLRGSFTGSYLASSLQISGLESVTDQSSPLSIFSGKNHVISISFNTRIEGKDLISKNQIPPAHTSSYSSVNSREVMPVVYDFTRNDEQIRGSFLYRNRFWVAGTAAVVVGSAAAAIIGLESSPVYLPEPPGRPAFNR